MRSYKLIKSCKMIIALLVFAALLVACTPAAAEEAAPSTSTDSEASVDSSSPSDAEDTTAPVEEEETEKTCIFIPKSLGNPWFITMQAGFDDYSAEEGGIKFTTQGADSTDPAAQVRVVEDAIAQNPDCIIVVPNDTAAIEPALEKGNEAGIMMLTQESPSTENAVADIEFLILEKEGKEVFDLLVDKAGTSGEYAIMVGGLTTEGHMARADATVAYQEANFPDWVQVSDRLEGSENAATAHDKTLALITAHPDIKGSSTSAARVELVALKL